MRAADAWGVDERDRFTRTPHDFWNEYIPEHDRAHLKVYRWVPLDRILAIDPLGDGFFPVPHIFVDFDDTDGPFSARAFANLERGQSIGRVDLSPEETNRSQIFPNPLPDELYPPPEGFDDTSNSTDSLSAAAEDKLGGLFTAVAERRKPVVATTDAPDDRADRWSGKMREFREWREAVARPLFSTFVHRLRAHGHWAARVVVRSIESEPHRREAFESVEFRVQLLTGTDTAYHPSGYVRVSMTDWMGCRMEVWPTRDETHSSRNQPTHSTVEGMGKELLEAEVVAVLERLARSMS